MSNPTAPSSLPLPREVPIAKVPLGALVREGHHYMVRLADGTGWHLGDTKEGVDTDPSGSGWQWSRGSYHVTLLADNLTAPEAIALSAMSGPEAIEWCAQRAKTKARPQPGDRVPWAEVEYGALYFVSDTERFRMVLWGTTGCMGGPDDPDIEVMLRGRYVGTPASDLGDDYPPAVLVARDLGTNPEAWRKAMREWTANGNKPAAASQPIAEAMVETAWQVATTPAAKGPNLQALAEHMAQKAAATPAPEPLSLGTARKPRTVAIALLNLAERETVGSDEFRWLVQESRAWAMLQSY